MQLEKITRKKFFRRAGILLLLPLLYFWRSTIIHDKNLKNQSKEVVLDDNIPEGVKIIDNVIVIKNNDQLKAFSNKCTHLGCSITSYNDGIFTCPCHGSQYDLNGKPVKGPSVKPLKKLQLTRQIESGIITIKI